MPFLSYSLRLVIWPVWAWEAHLPDGSTRAGFAIGRRAASAAARIWLKNAAAQMADGSDKPRDSG
jgi:hypothetical protein